MAEKRAETIVTAPPDGHHGWTGDTSAEARAATEAEHSLSIRQAIQKYPKACFWSCVVSLVIIMDGYDTALLGSLFAFPNFQKRFGIPNPAKPGTYQLEPKWQTALGLASSLEALLKTLLISLFWLTGTIFISFFAPSVEVLFVGQLLCGLGWGVFTTMGPAYASEVAPVVLRAYLETYVVLCWGIGRLLSYAVLDSLVGNTSIWAWRIPFAVQWVWPVIIAPLMFFCPESPWWLVRSGKLEEARKSLKRLTSISDQELQNQLSLMVETTELERSITEGASYLDCVRGSNLWRTEIACVAWASQVLVGFSVSSYATYFFEQAGMSTKNAYKLTVGQGGLHFVTVLLSVFIVARHGRRSIYIWACLLMSAAMFVIGFVAIPNQSSATGGVSAAFYYVWYSTYEMTIGPIAYIIVAEVSSTRLRSKTIGLARNAYNVINIAATYVVPHILNPTAGNWKGKSAFLAAGFCIICAVWAWFRLPELKGRTYEELDILFTKDLAAREFKGYEFDNYIDIDEKLGVEHKE
ncbi:hypothetical protein H9Q72_007289 [Fusarium xylarioides]|uniref:Major facilitator superfamily (MFS) profile domain-containing protein n=1 Tax=Fusarium xylarioides TaxID=221167 RepID=A0A9P7L553_9HYPO|nr:hypothetical protein H9Q72_007289 [Fusarium xylarioides]